MQLIVAERLEWHSGFFRFENADDVFGRIRPDPALRNNEGVNTGRTVFSQLMDYLPTYEFQKCVNRYQGEYKLRNFSCRDQFLSMAFAQLTYRESLRDIETCLRAIGSKLYHMGFKSTIARSTLADANESRDWRIYADFAQVLIAIARPLYAHDPIGVELHQSLYALDSTTIDLCLSLFPWARFRQHKAAVKMHTLLDLHGNIPTFIRITEGKTHDVNVLDEFIPEAGSFYVMDRGYIDVERLYRFTLCSAFFVVRTKENVLLQRRYSRPVDKATGLRSDHTVILTAIDSAKAYPDPLRRVTYFDAEKEKRLKFLTNNFALPALTIAQIYKCRWQVELFLESSTWCTPSDAMEFQELIALNRPLVGALDGSVRPCIARRLLCAESMVRPRKPASPATVSV